MWGKLLGKLMAYSGNLLAIVGIVDHNNLITAFGIIVLIVGCILHEMNEK
jgi:hypothetical protein